MNVYKKATNYNMLVAFLLFLCYTYKSYYTKKGKILLMRVVNIASGSKGNCTLIQSNLTTILIDEGLSLKNLEERLKQIDLNPNSIDAILITHEHSDHILGVKSFLKKYKNAKVYIPSFVQNYYISSIMTLPVSQVEWFTNSDFFIKDITISSFILPHDSNFCVGYSLYTGTKKITVATDLGFISQDTLNNLSGSDILFLESNHDEELLKRNVKYTAQLKKRILSNHGHLSNVACGEALSNLVRTGVKQVVLCHLSEENNTPDLAYNTVKTILKRRGIVEGEHVCVDVAFQNQIGTIFNF